MRVYCREVKRSPFEWQTEWRCNGLIHRIGGPAVFYRTRKFQYIGGQMFYIEGWRYSESAYKSALKGLSR